MPVGQDLILILVIVLVILLFWRGPKVLPKLGESLGQSISGFRKATKEAEPDDKSAVAEATTTAAATPSAPVASDPPADAGDGEPRA